MYLTEVHVWKKGKVGFDDCKEICRKSAVLYNACIPFALDFLEKTNLSPNIATIYNFVKDIPEYCILPRKVSCKILLKIVDNFKAYTKALKSFYKTPKKFKAKPLPPQQLKKGLFVTSFSNQAINRRGLEKNHYKLSGTNIIIKSRVEFSKIKEIRVIPRHNIFEIHVIHEVLEKENEELNYSNIASIDLGINNLAMVAFNGDNNDKALIINGKSIKSINQFFNKQLSKAKSELPQGIKSSKKIKSLYIKRDLRIKTAFHTASRRIVNDLIEKKVSTLVIGYNQDWKQNINLGKVNNQKFSCIPYLKFVQMLEYKCSLEGIRVVRTEESYTSKCSFFDSEPVKKHESYLGKRVKRGLFITSSGLEVNAYLNGALNIMKKVFPDAFAKGIEGVGVHPKRVINIF